jgi:ribosomal protein S18 acetylase RimI-like enzyme
MIKIIIADKEGIKALSMKLLNLLRDTNSEVYVDNVVKFSIPESYVKNAFTEDTLLKTRKTVFYTALIENEIVGFAQLIQQDSEKTVLDRIIVFPEQTRKGIGTKLLKKALEDEKRRGIKTIAVQAGKHEIQAKRFYEKNGFKKLKEETIDAPWGRKIDLTIYVLQLACS